MDPTACLHGVPPSTPGSLGHPASVSSGQGEGERARDGSGAASPPWSWLMVGTDRDDPPVSSWLSLQHQPGGDRKVKSHCLKSLRSLSPSESSRPAGAESWESKPNSSRDSRARPVQSNTIRAIKIILSPLLSLPSPALIKIVSHLSSQLSSPAWGAVRVSQRATQWWLM